MERAERGPGGWDSGTPVPATHQRRRKDPGSAYRGRCGAGGGG